MKTSMHGLVRVAALAGALLATAASVGAATPASTGKGTGCLVTDANGEHQFDAACQTHDVLKLDDAGNVQFYLYQDHAQLPAGAALPSTAIRSSYEACFHVGSVGVVCGTIVETLAPSGAYKSSFRSY